MGHVRTSSKRPTNVSLDDELVRDARRFTSNLSGTLEDLLRGFVSRERARRLAEDAAIDQVIDDLNNFHQQNGLLSDEFPSF